MVKAFAKILIAAAAAIQPAVAGAQSLTVHVRNGEPVTLQTEQVASITFTDDINDNFVAPKVGDFYYADGTWSSDIDYSKDVLGVVFYTGDPTAEDPILKADHPGCTHGLVLAAYAEPTGCIWQNDHITYGSAVGDWVTANLPGYISTESNYGRDQIRNLIVGYNNTKALRAFNAANPAYSVVPVEKIDAYQQQHAAPATSSGWYLPSVKELSMIINGVPDNDEILLATKTLANRNLMDDKLSYILGANLIYNPQWAYNFWGSNEFGANAYTICTFDGTIEGVYKDSGSNTIPRYVLAF